MMIMNVAYNLQNTRQRYSKVKDCCASVQQKSQTSCVCSEDLTKAKAQSTTGQSLQIQWQLLALPSVLDLFLLKMPGRRNVPRLKWQSFCLQGHVCAPPMLRSRTLLGRTPYPLKLRMHQIPEMGQSSRLRTSLSDGLPDTGASYIWERSEIWYVCLWHFS